MASLLSFVKKKAKQVERTAGRAVAQAVPFDNRTWQNPQGSPQPQQAPQRPIMRPNTPVQLGQRPVQAPLANRPTTPYRPPNLAPIVQPITRAIPNLIVSAGDAIKPGNQVFRPQPGIQQKILGKAPITSYQNRQAGLQKAITGQQPPKNANLEQQVVAGLRKKLAGPLSVAGTAFNAAGDASVALPVAKVATTGGKVGFKTVDQAAIRAAQKAPKMQIGAVGKDVPKGVQKPNKVPSPAPIKTTSPTGVSPKIGAQQVIGTGIPKTSDELVAKPNAAVKNVPSSMQPSFKRKTAENTKLNPTKVNIPEVQPGDYGRARVNPIHASNPIEVATSQTVNAAKKLTPQEKINIPHLVENPKLAKTPQAKEFVTRHQNLTNLTHATSQSLGGNTNFVPNYFRHAVDLANPEDAKRWEELVAKRGGEAADPYAFGGLDNYNRVFKSVKDLQSAGFHLKNENNPVQNIIDYGKSSANTLKRQALIKGITEADMQAPLKNRNFDLGNGQVVPVSEQGLKEIRAYGQYKPSTNKAIKGVRTANIGLKTSILSGGQFHPMNISVLRAGPSIAMPKPTAAFYRNAEGKMKFDPTIGSHPIRAAKGIGGTFRPLLPKGKGAVDKMYSRASTQGVVDPGTSQHISYVEAAAKIGAPYGARGYDVTGSSLKSGVGHKLVFERQMPMMHNQVVRSIVGDLTKRGIALDSSEARQAGIAANSTMGFINKEVLNISPKTWQTMNDWMLANQFTPSKIVTLAKTGKKGVAGAYARADVASNVLSATALITGVGFLVHQKSDSIRDSLLRALVNPAVPTPWKDKKGNNVELRIPLTYTGEISHLLGIKLKRQSDGHLGVTWNPGNAKETIPEWAKARLSPLAGIGVKLATNKNFADKPLYDPNAPAGKKAIQAGTIIGQGALPIGLQGALNTKVIKDRLPGSSKEVLDANTPGSNPLLKSGLSSVGFSPRTDQTVGKAKDTAQYFDALEGAKKGLNSQERGILAALTDSKKNPVTGKYQVTPSAYDSTAKADDLLQNPKVLTNLNKMNQQLKNEGEKVDPFYNLNKPQQIAVLQINRLDPGNPDKTQLVKQAGKWYNNFKGDQSKFFATLPAGDPNKPKAPVQYQEPSSQAQKLADQYYKLNDSSLKKDFIRSNPKIQEAFDATANYDTALRSARGLPELKGYPTASLSLQAKLNNYDSLSKSSRASYGKANPEIYDYFQKVSQYTLGSDATQARYVGNELTDKGTKAITSLANNIRYSKGSSANGGLARGRASSRVVRSSGGRSSGGTKTAKIKAPKITIAKAKKISVPKGVKVKKLASKSLKTKKLPVSKLPKVKLG